MILDTFDPLLPANATLWIRFNLMRNAMQINSVVEKDGTKNLYLRDGGCWMVLNDLRFKPDGLLILAESEKEGM